MKHSAIALGAACAVACSCAQARDQGLQLYGSIDASVGHFTGVRSAARGDDGDAATTSVTGMGAGGATGSVLGVRGGEALGSRLWLDFKAETGFCGVGLSQPDSGGDPYCSGGGFMQREAWLGLSDQALGDWRFGRQVSMLARHSSQADAFGNSFVGQVDNLSLVGNNGAAMGMKRMDQTVAWSLPGGSQGLGLEAQYSFHAGPRPRPSDSGEIHDPSALLLGLHYRSGNWLLGVDWSRWQHAIGVVEERRDHSYRLGLVYATLDLGIATLSGQFQQGRADGFGGEQRVLGLGLGLPLGGANGKLMLSVARFADSLAVAPASLGTSHATQYALGYSLELSRRTMVYASVARIENGAADANHRGTDLGVGAAGELFHGATGQPSSGMSLGIAHRF